MNRLVSMIVMVVVCMLVASVSRAEVYYVSPSGDDNGAGSAAAPWRTIQHGVDALKSGDTLTVEAGVYREHVEITHGGSAAAPITITAQTGARVIISGADRLRDWKPAAEMPAGIYSHPWSYRFPIGGPNDLTHPGDNEHQLTGRAEQVVHGGRLLRQVLSKEQLARGTFFVDLDLKLLYVWLRGGDDPNESEMEGSVRTAWITANAPASYVHLQGLTFRYAANHAQRGALSIGGGANDNSSISRGWLVEDCVFERSNASGGSFSGEGHLFRRCIFQDNGQLGFGTSRCNNTRMEMCGIYRNNTKGYSTGWEAGGLKVTMSRGFVFDGCRSVDNRGTGIWFDIGNEKCDVENCYIADNDEGGIFYEISYGLHAHDNVIVNNANNGKSVGGAWGEAGITLSSSQDCVVERNTLVGNRDGIALREQERSTPRIDSPDKEVRIFNRNHTIRNNVTAYSQAYNIAFWMDVRFFGPHPSGGDRYAPLSEDPATLNIRLENNTLWPLPGRPNYLFGVPWRPKGKEYATPAEFTAGSHIPDSSRVADPHLKGRGKRE